MMVVGPMLFPQKQWAKLEEVGGRAAVLEFAGTLEYSVFCWRRGFKVEGFEDPNPFKGTRYA